MAFFPDRRWTSLGLACLLGACAAPPKAPLVATPAAPLPAPLASMLAAADEAARLGQGEQARSLLVAAANAYPADKEPWLRLARRALEARNHREALNHAAEALARDGEERGAHAIALLSATRLANASALHLARGPSWAGPQRTEALEAARQLQASLAEAPGRSNSVARTGAAAGAGNGIANAALAAPAVRASARQPAGPDLTPLQKLEELKRNAGRGDAAGR